MKKRGGSHNRRVVSRNHTIESLEDRLNMAAFDLGSYAFTTTTPQDMGASGSWNGNYSGAALYDSGTDHKLLVPVNNYTGSPPTNEQWPAIVQYSLDGKYRLAASPARERAIILQNFDDVEAIVTMGGGKFVIVEEKRWEITVVDISATSSNTINKSSLPNGAYTLDLTGTGLNLNDNDGLGGLAFEPGTGGNGYGVFYAAEEYEEGVVGQRSTWYAQIWSIPAPQPPTQPSLPIQVTATKMSITGLQGSEMLDISDIHYQKVGANEYLFALSEEPIDDNRNTHDDGKIRRIQLTSETAGALESSQRFPATGSYLQHTQAEGLTFTPNGLSMLVIGEGDQFA